MHQNLLKVQKEYANARMYGRPYQVRLTACGPDPNDTFDADPYVKERAFLGGNGRVPDELRAEYAEIVHHLTRGYFMGLIARCQVPDCDFCGGPTPDYLRDEVDDMFDKFGGALPTPVPALAERWVIDRSERWIVPTGAAPLCEPVPGKLRYLGLVELMKTNVPAKYWFIDQYCPEFPRKGAFCGLCETPVLCATGTGAERHTAILHSS